jgi:hypothetical protein
LIGVRGHARVNHSSNPAIAGSLEESGSYWTLASGTKIKRWSRVST